jgi:hypothetical protein
MAALAFFAPADLQTPGSAELCWGRSPDSSSPDPPRRIAEPVRVVITLRNVYDIYCFSVE